MIQFACLKWYRWMPRYHNFCETGYYVRRSKSWSQHQMSLTDVGGANRFPIVADYAGEQGYTRHIASHYFLTLIITQHYIILTIALIIHHY